MIKRNTIQKFKKATWIHTLGIHLAMLFLANVVHAQTLNIEKVSVSGCYYSAGSSKCVVSVQVGWTGLVAGDNITVSLGTASKTIAAETTPAYTKLLSPQVVSFEIPSDGSAGTISASVLALNANSAYTAQNACDPLQCNSGELGGQVFRDFNSDGIHQITENQGEPSIVITATDNFGGVYTTTSDNQGKWQLNILNTNYPVRVEFSNIPAFLRASSTIGALATTQFISNPTCSLDLGVLSLTDYAQNDPDVYVPIWYNGDPSDVSLAGHFAFSKYSYSTTSESSVIPGGIASDISPAVAPYSQTGPTWGLAWDKNNKKLYAGAVVRRHAGLGPQGLAGLYRYDPVTNLVVGTDLTTLGLNFGSIGSNASRGTGSIPNPSYDLEAFGKIGKVGIGGISISDDGTKLYVMNLFLKKIHVLSIPGLSLIQTLDVPNPLCTGGEYRPWSVKYYKNKLYVGVICDGQTSQNKSDMKATVYEMNATTGTYTSILEFPLTYPKGTARGGTESGWFPWTDDYLLQIAANPIVYMAYPTPILSDLDFDIDGAMVIGFTDRFASQWGWTNYAPDPAMLSTTTYEASAGGDILRAFKSNGVFALENAGQSGDLIGGSTNNNEGPGFGEFFNDNFVGHNEVVAGGLAIKPGSGEVFIGAMDPGTIYCAGGVKVFNSNNGSYKRAVNTYGNNCVIKVTPTFGKSNGLGDIELALDVPNYSQIGDRVWQDTDADGIQDPGEPGIDGIVMGLFDASGNLVGTTTTANGGYYYFGNNENGINLIAGATYYVVAGYNQYSSNNGLVDGSGNRFGSLTLLNTGEGPNPTNNDNNGSIAANAGATANFAGLPYTTVFAPQLNSVNHTYDFGFTKGSIGNYVWLDDNHNGLQDEPSSNGLNGLKIYLYKTSDLNVAIDSVITSNDVNSNPGYYNFSIYSSDDYVVKFPTFEGLNKLTFTTITSATDGNSDANAITGLSPVVTINVKGVGVTRNNNTIDAGYQEPLACLGNYVFNDLNQDGNQNNGEVGVSGVTTTLYNATTNAILATVTTDAYGYYQFCGLFAGDYRVGFSLPTNYVFTTANNGVDDGIDSDPNTMNGLTATVALAPGDSNMTVDAGIYQPLPITATVGDRVWFDADGNGVQDVFENGVSGITVSLFTCADPTTPIATTMTDAVGNYLFENVASGSYSVWFSLPVGMVFTAQNGAVNITDNSDANTGTGKTACFAVNSGDSIRYVDAGIKPKPNTTISIGDRVWNDANHDGIQDPGEAGVAGVTVTLYDETGTSIIYTTTTDGLGNYGFNGFPAGCYVVGFDLPGGYTRSTQNAGTDSAKNSDANTTTGMTNQICITGGQNNPTIDAGIYNAANTNSIGDKVWYDENINGLQDGTEYGYPGVVVTLYNCTANTIVANTTTNANGNYLFGGLANGDYYVGFGFISGYSFTGANRDVAGILGGNNSDANPSNGLTACVSLTGNTNITTIDAGIYPGNKRNATSSLGDIVWTDVNNNGVQDNGETGVTGITVKLFDATTNTELASTITDGLGNYIFTNLSGGNYKVEFSNIPSGYTFATQTGNIEDELNSDANPATGMTNAIALNLGEDKMTVDAGIVAPTGTVCLGDYVWIDLNNNGTQDATEPAVPGVTVKLYDNNTNTVLQVATTNSEGKYLFCGLTTGSIYSVGFENLPAGFAFTAQNGTLSTTDNSDANPSTGRTTAVILGATNDLTLDAGIYSATTAVLGNYVWYDEDADGKQDATEAPISGVLVTLYNSSNTAVASAVTDANGAYLFTNVTPGDYTIGFAGYPGSLTPTTKGTTNPATADDDSNVDPITGRTDAFTVTSGSSNLTLDAGYKANPIAGLGNYVWLDVNENGFQEASEPAISGVIVTLYAANGITALGTAITDGNGAYSFPNLTAGDFVVGFSNMPTEYTKTQSIGTLTDALNSDINTSNKTVVITLTSGTYNPNIDAGFYKGVPLGVKELKATTAIINENNSNDCQVNWYTTDEENTLNFNITRSADGIHFTKVGTQNANNYTTGRTNYSFDDNIEAIKNASTIYYQIVLNDIDGKHTLSNIIRVKTNTTVDITVYPIPFTNFITINYPGTEATSIVVLLTDVSGRTIRTMHQEIAQGNNTLILNGLEKIASGAYFLRIVDNNSGIIYSQKLTK